MRSLVWFRRDLRVADNTALFHAARDADAGVIGLFVLTPAQWQKHDDASRKVKFWLDNLNELANRLAELNIPLLVEAGDSFNDVPGIIVDVATQHGYSAVYWNREYEVYETRRDERVELACRQSDIAVHQFHDRVIVPPKEIATKQGKFYSVFTPYRRVWDSRAVEFLDVHPSPDRQPNMDVPASKVPSTVEGFELGTNGDELWPPGESEAQRRLAEFTERIAEYDEDRDIPAVNGTSQLSPYLAAGVISPRQCLAAAMAASNRKNTGDGGASTWISELTWRDFYTHVMVACPRVSMHQPFKPKTSALPWRTDRDDFEAWTQGQTGYPLVDAGMRQLNRTGWMHNRLRMVTAMFLSKNLLIDWRWGEQYFMQQLIDGDLAANNGGWQWSASTGTDSVPYFRIFNPFSQSKRFDPDGTFIKQMCPELNDVPKAALHDPGKLTAAIQDQELEYPDFVVDYRQGRERALQAFKSLG